MWGTQYAVYLEGINQVALSRRWDMFIGFASSASMAVALHYNGGLLELVACYQGWALLRVAVFRRLQQRFRLENPAAEQSGFDRDTFSRLWAGAWRSGVGGVMSYGLVGISGFMVAHAGEPTMAASFLVSSRLLDTLLQFSQAPFYGRLPQLAALRASGNAVALIASARRGMLMGYWCFMGGFLTLALFANVILHFIGSRASFVRPDLWAIMGLATLAQFFGAMHIQLYSTTDHIIWHVANTVAGTIFLAVCWVLLPHLGVYAVPTGWLCGYAGFYAWYSARHAYRSIDVTFWRFEKRLALPPALIMVTYGVFAILSNVDPLQWVRVK